jgi:hypothetical protein
VTDALDWIPLSRVAERTGLTERRLRRLIRQHSVPVMRHRRDIWFDEESLAELKEAMRFRPEEVPPAGLAPVPAQRPTRHRIVAGSAMAAALRATAPKGRAA